EAKLRAECCIANKAKLCCAYLKKCENFKKSFFKDIVEEILALLVSEDKINSSEENEETKVLFDFVAPELSLPNYRSIGDQILMNTAKSLKQDIVKIAANDKYGIIATFDEWFNIKIEQLWADMIRHIEKMMKDAKKKNIKIKALVSDSAGKYAAASDILYHCQKQARELDTKIQHLHLTTPIVENEDLSNLEDIDSSFKDDLQINNIIDIDKNINNEDDLALSELDESNSEEQVQEWNIFIEE
ncbi:17356_t:CDS:2, partial [Racocetra persica]